MVSSDLHRGVYHLPAYVALQRWVARRTVVVVGSQDATGLEALLRAGPKRILIVDAEPGVVLAPRDGVEVEVLGDLGDPRLRDGSVDVLACLENYSSVSKTARGSLLARAATLLGPHGVFAASLPQVGKPDLDFWDFEDELRARFGQVRLLAQMPWHGVSLAPVLDDDDAAVQLDVDEALLQEPPRTSHYVAIAARGALPEALDRWLTQHCVMVPVPGLAPEAQRDPAEYERLEQDARRHAIDVSVLTRTVRELEESVARLRKNEEALRGDAQSQAQVAAELKAKYGAATAERETLARQLELTIADRESSRQLATRMEAELDLARRRMGELDERIADKTEALAKASSDLAVVQTRLEHQTSLLQDAKSREAELSTTAAEGVERSRALSEVAQDRDRLREELTRRSTQLSGLEERLWTSRDEVQQERLEVVRLTGEVERLRERLDRHQQVEERQTHQIERLSDELHRLEVDRATASALLAVREEEIDRLARQAASSDEQTDEIQGLQVQVGEHARHLAEARAQLEPLRVRETEARTLADERKKQLAEVRAELDELRDALAKRDVTTTELENQLEVRRVEIEQGVATVAELREQLGQERARAERAEERERELQQEVERRASEQQRLRDRLRRRDTEFEELVSAGEANEVELYKLRHDLESKHDTRETLAAVDVVSPSPASPAESASISATTDTSKVQRLQLEVEVRAQEQEHILSLLDAAEQQIWEMSDAADRNAARLAASLAQLENAKEQLAEVQDELEVTRKLLTAAQARALEQERLLASERAKLARLGAAGPSALESGPGTGDDVEQLFAELELGDTKMVSLSGPSKERSRPKPPRIGSAAPEPAADSRPSVEARAGSTGPRVVVEALEDTDWPDESR